MDVICAPMGIMSTRYPKQGLMDMADAGFKGIFLELSMFWPAGGPKELHNKVKPVLAQCRGMDLCMPVASGPSLSGNAEPKDGNGLLRLAQEGIRICQEAGSKYIIIKPLSEDKGYEETWKANREYYLRLADTAREGNIKILLENQCRNLNGHLVRGICSDAGEASGWIDRLNHEAGEERFGFCMDAGTCNICGQNMQEFVFSLGKRIKAVILRDCNRQEEASMLPFTCSGFDRFNTDWLGLIRGLRETGFDGAAILNFAATASWFSPLLRPQLLALAKAVGEYFQWQIGMENLLKRCKSIVLFGAGNMCRNYMKCYGEKYPPLFTCDNDSRLWGTSFCGLEIKPPECLKKLDEDCAIFICSTYYREIQQQLWDMGISNDIEFFSDEYMPSFYFNRLERGN